MTDSSTTTFYPGSFVGFTSAGSFFVLWGLGNLVSLTTNMNPSAKKWVAEKLLCGRKIPVEGLWLTALGFLAFFIQLGNGHFKFYDKSNDYYVNQNNLRDAFFYFGLGLTGLIQLMTTPLKLSHMFAKMFIVLPFFNYVLSLSFKAQQTMTNVDYTIFVVQIVLFAITAVILIAEAVFVDNAYLWFGRSMLYGYSGVWYLQTANFYWGYTKNALQDRYFANEYVLNVLAIEIALVSLFFGVIFFLCTRNYDGLLAEAQYFAEEKKRGTKPNRFTPAEAEISMESQDGNLLRQVN
jgi:hypothetical protein